MPSDAPLFSAPISRVIWETKYRLRDGSGSAERDIDQTWWRVARALAQVEPTGAREIWGRRFHGILEDFRFLPGGRILAGAGSAHRVTLFNCFVMGLIEDSLDRIFDALKEGALTMQQGGGIGYDFSTLRPRGMPALSAGSIASGPISFMRIWDSMCATVLSTSNRRGAMMATLRCDHPDIEDFIDAKRDPRELRHFNLSVQVTDEFMSAVREDAAWPLVFPTPKGGAIGGNTVLRRWSGTEAPAPCTVTRTISARELWDHIMRLAYESAEPGVLFIDRINRSNNLWYREHITATNPCGEIPLPPYGACNLGSINLTRFVRAPLSAHARLDMDTIEQTARTATRMLDNVIQASRFPLPQQRQRAHECRRIGLGITGLADALIMLGLHYDSHEARELAAEVIRRICHTAYRSSMELASEKGAFPTLDAEPYLSGPFTRALPRDIRDGIRRNGLRNSHLTAIAPAGTISLLADNVSSGLEPVFDFHYRRKLLDAQGGCSEFELDDYAWRLWNTLHPETPPPAQFVRARDLDPLAHLQMQAALQAHVDNAISKTINVPADIDFERFKSIYAQAYDRGLKGCTTYRPNPVSGAVLDTPPSSEGRPRCCSMDAQ